VKTSSPLRRTGEALLVAVVTIACAFLLRTFVVEAYRIPSASMENTLLIGDLVLVNKLSYGLRTPGLFPFSSIRLTPSYLVSAGNVQRGDVIVFEFTMRSPDGLPADLSYYVKRCVGIPGDTVEIRQGRVFVNGLEMLPPSTVINPQFRRTLRREATFPEGAGFTDLDYGPIRVPHAGDVVPLTPETMKIIRPIILHEGHNVWKNPGGEIRLDGNPADTYTVRGDYYFVLGDHRDNSSDSRMWGFVEHEEIVGEAMMVYWSTEDDRRRDVGAFRVVRWNRIGTLVR